MHDFLNFPKKILRNQHREGDTAQYLSFQIGIRTGAILSVMYLRIVNLLKSDI